MSIPKMAVLATGLTAAILVATIHPTPAQAFPSSGTTCTVCHAAGGSVTATPSGGTSLAPNATYTVAIVLTNTATGDSGYNISLAGASLDTGGPAAGKTFSATMTAPAVAGTYVYTVGANTGPRATGQASATTYSITVEDVIPPTTVPPTTVPPTTVPPTTVPPTTVPPTTVPPTTVPPTTVPPTTVPPTTIPPTTVVTAPGAPTGVTATPGNGSALVSWTPSTIGSPATSYTVTVSPGGRTFTTTGTSVLVTGLTNGTRYTFTVTATNAAGTSAASAVSAAVVPSITSTIPVTGVVPAGAPSTGAGGASNSGDSPLTGLGGLALLLAGAAMVPAIRRRRV